MFNLTVAETIASIVALFIAYATVNTLVGAFRAWITNYMGDDTGKSLGLVTLNPVAHIDLLGLFFLVFFQLPFRNFYPINPAQYHAPHRTIKLIIANLADCFGYLIITIVSMIFLLLLFDLKIVIVTSNLFVSMKYLASAYPNHSSLSIVVGLLLTALVYLSVILAALSLVVNFINLFVSSLLRHYQMNSALAILLPLLFIIFFYNRFLYLIVTFITYTSFVLAWCMGII